MTDVPTCLAPVRDTRQVTMEVPAGAVDCHTHLFEDKYPLSPNRGYNPPESNLDHMLAMHGALGVERVVFTQPSVYGTDNSAILDGMAALGDKARAVVAIDGSESDDQLAEWDTQGVRGIRLNLDNVGGMPVTLDQVPDLARRVDELGWHLEFLFPGPSLTDLAPMLRQLATPISIGHFSYMPASEGIEYPPFQLLLELVREGNTWIKLSGPNRLGVGDLPPWPEVVPLAHALIEANPDRMLWATDWPHPNKYVVQPNDADLIEQLELWAPDPEMRRRILVDNPETLYRF